MKKNRKNKMSWYSDAPEDEVISLFEGLLANPDVPLSLEDFLPSLGAHQGGDARSEDFSW
jgi:hypothetical protein